MILVYIACIIVIDAGLFDGYITKKIKAILSKFNPLASSRKKG